MLAATPGSANAALGSDAYGVNGNELYTLSKLGQTTLLETQLEALEKTGIESVRVSVSWSDYDNFASQGLHPWRNLDAFATALAEHRISMLPVPRGAPWWARASTPEQCPDRDRSAISPDAFDEYGSFAGAIASRYGPGGAFWQYFSELPAEPVTRIELWNEPNWTGFWCPAPDPESFAGLLAAGAEGVAAANPEVDAVFGGLVSVHENTYYSNGALRGIAADRFLERVLAEAPELADTLDGVAIHLYELTAERDLEELAWWRSAMTAAGVGGTPIVISEFGWNQLDLSEAAIAENMTAFVPAAARSDCGVEAIAAHSWITDEANALDPEDWWGLVDPVSGLLYAGAVAYQEAIAALRASSGATEYVCGRAPEPAPEADPPPASDEPETATPSSPAAPTPRGPSRRKTRDRTPKIRFDLASELRAECQVDSGGWRRCGSPFTTKRLRPGHHTIRLRSREPASGTVGETTKLRITVLD